MTIIAHPRLGPTAWTTSLAEKADGLLADAFATDSNQTPELTASTISIADIIKDNFTNPTRLVADMNNKLNAYLLRYYPQGVIVNVTSSATSPAFQGGPYTVTVTATVTEEGEAYDFAYLVSQSDGIVKSIARINNTGS